MKGIKRLDLGVEIGSDHKVSILLFADDIVLIAPSEPEFTVECWIICLNGALKTKWK